MDRRRILKWLSGALGAASAAAIVLPGGRFLAVALHHCRRGPTAMRRVARLDSLVVGKPRPYPVLGSRQDAWTLYPQEVIGRVWLVREEAASSEEPPKVTAFTAVCPHLGCLIQTDPGGQRFVCPCHRAVFDLHGGPMPDENGKPSHAPRGMDRLECRLVRDGNEGPWWVEVKYEKFEPGLTAKVPKA